jgi:integrase/recombinase XerD
MDNTCKFRHPPVGVLADIIIAFILFKRSLGYIYKTEEGILYRFSVFSLNFAITGHEVPLQLIEGWLELRKNEKASTQRTRGNCVLQMLGFAQKHGYIVHFPLLVRRIRTPRYVPYIFSKKELEDFFNACDHIRYYPGTSRHHTLPILFRLIYSCGLRASEAANLKCNHVDLARGVITIRAGKNGKDRLVPLSDSMAKCIQQYQQRYYCGDNKDKYFFKGKYKNKLTRYKIYKWFRICLESAGIHHLGRGKGPREHDLRHSFCVHSLKKMQEQGRDLYASLPVISTYVGHASINATQHYLRLTAEFFPDVIELLDRQCSGVIPSVEVSTNETN